MGLHLGEHCLEKVMVDAVKWYKMKLILLDINSWSIIQYDYDPVSSLLNF